MQPRYPNLELLGFQAEMMIGRDCGKTQVPLRMTCEVFCQVWPSTCLAFDTGANGAPMFGGQAMTPAYTTVFHEEVSNIYVVFVDGKPCYKVTEPNGRFLSDLKEHRLAGLSEAGKVY